MRWENLDEFFSWTWMQHCCSTLSRDPMFCSFHRAPQRRLCCFRNVKSYSFVRNFTVQDAAALFIHASELLVNLYTYKSQRCTAEWALSSKLPQQQQQQRGLWRRLTAFSFCTEKFLARATRTLRPWRWSVLCTPPAGQWSCWVTAARWSGCISCPEWFQVRSWLKDMVTGLSFMVRMGHSIIYLNYVIIEISSTEASATTKCRKEKLNRKTRGGYSEMGKKNP